MIISVTNKEYWSYFKSVSNPYITEWFLHLNKEKVDNILFLMNENDKSIGLVAGVKDNMIYSPFSAPFGGFHYSHEHLMYDTIYSFIDKLKEYVEQCNLSGIKITLPPDIYQTNMNAKLIHTLINTGYSMSNPNILNWTNISTFDGKWVYNKVENRCRKAILNELSFHKAIDTHEIEEAYSLIRNNRIGKGRSISMSLDDIIAVGDNIPVDFFIIKDKNNDIIGASVVYRGSSDIAQAIFIADDLNKRDLGTIDFLYMNIYNHYKELNYKYIDFGTSSLNGEPNIGLMRFKEIHNCETSLQYSFMWSPSN